MQIIVIALMVETTSIYQDYTIQENTKVCSFIYKFEVFRLYNMGRNKYCLKEIPANAMLAGSMKP